MAGERLKSMETIAYVCLGLLTLALMAFAFLTFASRPIVPRQEWKKFMPIGELPPPVLDTQFIDGASVSFTLRKELERRKREREMKQRVV